MKCFLILGVIFLGLEAFATDRIKREIDFVRGSLEEEMSETTTQEQEALPSSEEIKETPTKKQAEQEDSTEEKEVPAKKSSLSEEDRLLNTLVSETQKRRESLRKKASDEEVLEEEEGSPSHQARGSLDFGDVEIQVSDREKEPYIEQEIVLGEDENEILTFKPEKRKPAGRKE